MNHALIGKNINILLFSREYPPNIIGGTAIVAKSSAEGLQKLGYNVTVISSYLGDRIKIEIINNVKVILINDNAIYMDHSEFETEVLKHHKRVVDVTLNEIEVKPDIILLPDLFSFPEAFIVAKKLKTPLINILLQDFKKMIIYDKLGSHKVTNRVNGSESDLLGVEEKSIFKSDKNIFISNALTESIVDHYKLNIDNYKTIYLGINKDELDLKDNVNYKEIREEICPRNKKLFATVGRLVPVKGFDYLIKAFKQINEYDHNTFLCIMGTGPEEDYLKDLVVELQLENSVKIFYEPDRSKVVSYMNVCDYAVVPSLWESFCYVAAEFMAMGKPLVVSGVDSLNELIINKETGLVCPVIEEDNKRIIDVDKLASLMKRLLDDKELAVKFQHNAKERVYKLFTEELYAKNLSKLILEMIQ